MDLLEILDTKPVPAIVDARTLGIAEDTSGDYWLPTTMCLYQKELTDQIVSLHYSDILRYFETNDYKEDVIVESMKTMCLNSAYVATHPYLLIDHHMPRSLITKDIPGQLAETSGKFTALRDLMNLVQEYETDTAIACRPGRTMDLLEALLLGNKVCIKRYDKHSIKSKQRARSFPCTCHIFPSHGLKLEKNSLKTSGQFDMLICLDPTVDTTNEQIQRILRHKRNPKSSEAVAPIVRLATINSVDHCELYFGKQYQRNSREFLESVTAAVVVLRDRVGILPPDLRPIYSQNLRYLINWLEDPSIPWPLPNVYRVNKYTSMDVERSLLTEVHYSQVEDELDAAFNGKKRGRSKTEKGTGRPADVSSFYSSKRLKNDYTTNPSKQNMAELTGITTADEASHADYHLSSGILTHRLIQSMGQTYVDLAIQTREYRSYIEMDAIQEAHKSTLYDKLSEVEDKVAAIVAKEKDNMLQANRIDDVNENKRQEIQKVEANIERLLGKLSDKAGKFGQLKELYERCSSLADCIDKEKNVSKSKESEQEYTLKECERADCSISDSKAELDAITENSKRLREELNSAFDQSNIERQEIEQRIATMLPAIEIEKAYCKDLNNKLSQIVDQLNSMPQSRLGLLNGKGSSSRRHKNTA
ncbi:hypothetical protein HG536_0F00400 [Torulaspora globosa]|uniref:HDA1 complex subunit 3 n=1 Tax=Torulaspora globosa TaxID=48254 RepID=A0A7G3ZJN0_9SACH|nr:uncharacterized protein HG536_0F00400 [Torulaspora globosa]QLL33716.1 hypothetical protein HG536_0F00400 [Torulaspora globosa]